jgi:hypothetical protein
VPDIDEQIDDTVKVDSVEPDVTGEKPVVESSATEDVSETAESGTLSIVRDVVAKGEKPEDAVASSAEGEAVLEEGANAEQEVKEPDNENFSDVPFHKHPRFQKLVSERNELRGDAQRYRNVEAFIAENGLSAEETADLIQIGGLMKTDPAEAWKRMKPVVENVLKAAGELLPPDLKSMVDAGQMTVEAAKEVSRARASVASVQATSRWQQQRQQVDQQQAVQTAISGAVSSWEAERQTRDPNFAAKLPALQREVAFLQTTEGRPKTPEGVRAQLQKAYDAVNQTFTPPQPVQPKKAIVPVKSAQVNGNARPQNESTLDVVNSVLARRAG